MEPQIIDYYNIVDNRMSLSRLNAELKNITKNLPSNCTAYPSGEDIYNWQATIKGPSDSPYEDGIFFLNILFSPDYPFQPPKIRFETKVYHCNINFDGWISLDVLSSQWTPAFTIASSLLSITSLLSDPNPDNPLVPEIARLYKEDKVKHDKVAKEWTQKYAT